MKSANVFGVQHPTSVLRETGFIVSLILYLAFSVFILIDVYITENTESTLSLKSWLIVNSVWLAVHGLWAAVCLAHNHHHRDQHRYCNCNKNQNNLYMPLSSSSMTTTTTTGDTLLRSVFHDAPEMNIVKRKDRYSYPLQDMNTTSTTTNNDKPQPIVTEKRYRTHVLQLYEILAITQGIICSVFIIIMISMFIHRGGSHDGVNYNIFVKDFVALHVMAETSCFLVAAIFMYHVIRELLTPYSSFH